MKRTNIYCEGKPEEIERLYELANENGIPIGYPIGNNDTAIIIDDDGHVCLYKRVFDWCEQSYTKITLQQMEEVITAKPVYLTPEQWKMVAKSIEHQLPNIYQSIQSQLKP